MCVFKNYLFTTAIESETWLFKQGLIIILSECEDKISRMQERRLDENMLPSN